MERSEVFHAFAIFADAQHQEIRKVADEKEDRYDLYAKRKRAEDSEMAKQLLENPDSTIASALERSKGDAKRAMKDDASQLKEVRETASVMLRQALTNYASALVASNHNDDDVLRFTSLWLANAHDDDLNERTVAGLVVSIPSHKFIVLFHQLSARLEKSTEADSPFTRIINKLIFQICCEHPFHSLYQINALRNPELVALSTPLGRNPRRSSTPSFNSTPGTSSKENGPRALAAEAIMDKVSQAKSKLKTRVAAIKQVCSAYLAWANYSLSSNPAFCNAVGKAKQGKQLDLPKDLALAQLADLPIPITTCALAIDFTFAYDPKSYPCITKYSRKFSCPGGVTEPKHVKCVGSDGKSYGQLVRSFSIILELAHVCSDLC